MRYIRERPFIKWPKEFLFNDLVIEDLRDGSRNMKAVLVGAADGKRDVNGPFREAFLHCVEAAGENLDIKSLEKLNTKSEKHIHKAGKEIADYWKNRVDLSSLALDEYSYEDYTRYRPYTTEELQLMIPRGVAKNDLPCFLIYGLLEKGHILLTIQEGMTLKEAFDALLSTFLFVQGRINDEISVLRMSIESELKMAGQVLEEEFNKEVDKILNSKGAELFSFDYFKEFFLEVYPIFSERPSGSLTNASENTQASERLLPLIQHLTIKEKEVIKFMVQGLALREIAEQLMLVPRSVDTIYNNLRLKLRLTRKREIINFAHMVGLVD